MGKGEKNAAKVFGTRNQFPSSQKDPTVLRSHCQVMRWISDLNKRRCVNHENEECALYQAYNSGQEKQQPYTNAFSRNSKSEGQKYMFKITQMAETALYICMQKLIEAVASKRCVETKILVSAKLLLLSTIVSPPDVSFSIMHLSLELTLLSSLLEARRQFLGFCGQPRRRWNDHCWPLSFGS